MRISLWLRNVMLLDLTTFDNFTQFQEKERKNLFKLKIDKKVKKIKINDMREHSCGFY